MGATDEMQVAARFTGSGKCVLDRSQLVRSPPHVPLLAMTMHESLIVLCNKVMVKQAPLINSHTSERPFHVELGMEQRIGVAPSEELRAHAD